MTEVMQEMAADHGEADTFTGGFATRASTGGFTRARSVDLWEMKMSVIGLPAPELTYSPSVGHQGAAHRD